MKFSRLTFLASLLRTLLMVLVAWTFHYTAYFFSSDELFYAAFALVFLLIFAVNYFFLEYLFNFYTKRQVRKISNFLPDSLMNQDSISLAELGERVSELNQKNVSEIDMMKEMERYRKEYIGNVSHEMKTPLFSIQGYVETLLDGGVENLNIRDKYLDRIDKSVQRLLNITTDLDMLTKFEAGEISLTITRFDINAVVREIFDLLDLEATKMNAKLILQSAQPQHFVKADRQKISQVLLNLIANAVYYSNRDEAKITVKTSALKNKVLIEVSDNGMGIKAEYLPRIFERFYRVESSRNRRDGGSGLGLAIVKHILEAHRENISVKSVYLEGTSFSFQLNRA